MNPKNMNINEIKNKIKTEESFLTEKFRVKRVGIFGSYARGEQKKTSDVDVLVEFFEEPSLFEFIRMERYLKNILKIKVDLVMKDSLKPYIGKHILDEVIYI